MKISLIYYRIFFGFLPLLLSSVVFSSVRAGDFYEQNGTYEDSVENAKGIAQLGERILDLVTWEKEKLVFTVYPSLSVSPRNGFVYGVMPAVKWPGKKEGTANTLTINAETSTKGMLQLQFEHEWYFHENWLTRGEAFVNKRQDLFWIGKPESDFYFSREEFMIDWDLLNNFLPHCWLGIQVFVNDNLFSKEAVDVFSTEQLSGAEGGLIFGVGPKFLVDTRERTLAPQTGVLLEFKPLFIGVAGLGDYKYTRFTCDLRKYMLLKRDKTTLAFQAVVDYAGNEVPFYDAPQLGGKERLRGIGHPMRETGNSVWMGRVELRQHLWWRFGAVTFAGLGRADDNFQHPFENTVSSFGGGLRFRMLPDDPLNVRFDFGVSSLGTTGFFISLKEAF